ncbi:MAG: hypothetical protein RL030_1964 [Pseudomonadota bacterium]|jgi:hypothetical protein
MRLSLFVVDFHLEKSTLEGRAVEQLPALGALESLLCRGRRLPAQPDWRAALLTEVGLPASPAVAPARVAARMLDTARPDGAWLAQPVHRVAGLSNVSLHPAGLLRLSAQEAGEWSRDFNRDFAGSGLRLHALAPGLLLEGLPASTSGGSDPAQFLGSRLPATLSSSSAERPLRQASAEIEMWLHEHPRNRERERRGELPLNGLWLWGGQGSELPSGSSVPVPLPQAMGVDPFLRGLWRALGATAQEVQRFAELPANTSPAIVVQSAAAQSPRDQPMLRLEADWFAPMADALARRELLRLRLWIGGRGWEVVPSRLSRIGWAGHLPWRRPRPWWQQVTA